MHRLATHGAVLALTTLAAAQSPLTTTFASNNGGSAGGAVYFDLVVNTPVEITAIDINTGAAASTAGGITVYVGCVPTFQGTNHMPASNWTTVRTGAGTSAGLNLATNCPLNAPLALLPGTYPIALVASSTWSFRYTNGTGTSTTTYSTAELSLVAGGATNVPFTGAQFFPRLFNGSIYYNTALTTAPLVLDCATATSYGAGCQFGASSFYELGTPLSGFDLAGSATAVNSIQLTYLGAQGYAVTQGAAAFFTPTGAPVLTNAATPGPMGDDSISQPLPVPATWNGNGTWIFPGGSCSQFHACSNGYVVCGSTTATTGDFSPTVAELLSSALHSGTGRLCPVWADWHASNNLTTNPNSGVYFDVDPAGNRVYITWLEVGEFGQTATSLNTFQVAIHQNGDVDFVYGQMQRVAGTSAWITGWSKGNVGGTNAVDPGNRDISASMPFATNGPDRTPIAFGAGARPVIGTTVALTTTNIPAGATVTVHRLTFTQISPGLNLASFGAPDCFAHVGVSGPDNLFLFGTPSTTSNLVLPNDPGLAGIVVYGQSASFVPGINAFGIITSNGIRLRVGTL